MEDKYIGLLLALSSSIAIGSSFVLMKKGLNQAASHNVYGTSASDNLVYLRNPMWWAGMTTIANFAAYAFAPPILVTPLGALSVLIGAVLASFLLNEELGHLGRVGCTLCLLGSLIIILHAPAEQEVDTVDKILGYALQPGFLLYCFTATVFSLIMIYKIAPKYGRSNPLVYVSICSVVGSVSVMAIKGFGIAVKLTFAGNNQFIHPSTYVFGIVTGGCIVIQMNYFNKALDTFSTNVVNPMYYVGFSSATIVASLILFQGFNTADASNTFSLLAGFIVTFLGVHLLNLSRVPEPPLDGHQVIEGGLMNPRQSLQGRMSMDGWNGPERGGMDVHMNGLGGGRAGRHGRQSSLYRSQTTTLFNAFEDAGGHKRAPSGGAELHQLQEADEWEDDFDADGQRDEGRALLKKDRLGQLQQQQQRHANGGSRSPIAAGSRSHSHSPIPDSSLSDVRITPR
ncbi:magnesium transporter NIPA-domain-containing protein [Panaeolus papilionaceus]|nr:magnesium transporter NIPA-domain-containing protein [Panaeolus papilionaceus]